MPPRPRRSGCKAEEVEFMTSATVKRVFEVDAPLEEAWQRLAEVERWPEWAPHITSVTVSPPGSSVPPQAVPCRSSGWGATPSACRSGSRQCVGSGSAGCLGSASTTTIGSSRWARQRHGWNGWSSSMGPWRRSFDLSSPACTVAISTGRSPDCRVVSPLMAGNAGGPPPGVRGGGLAGRTGAGGRGQRGCRSPRSSRR